VIEFGTLMKFYFLHVAAGVEDACASEFDGSLDARATVVAVRYHDDVKPLRLGSSPKSATGSSRMKSKTPITTTKPPAATKNPAQAGGASLPHDDEARQAYPMYAALGRSSI